MIDRVDRVQVAVFDSAKAAQTYQLLLGAEVRGNSTSSYLGARRTILALGESEIELCQPFGSGIAAQFLVKHGEGLISAGLSTPDFKGLRSRLAGLGIPAEVDGDQFYVAPENTFGMRFVISPSHRRPQVGPVSFLYEVTNVLTGNWQRAAAHYAGLFGLDPCGFRTIQSKRFAYTGSLALFKPPDKLDRIEMSQVTEPHSAMGRWLNKYGDSFYMCFCESHNLGDIIARLNKAGARWTPRNDLREIERDVLWVHPSSLHGVLLGISRTSVAWDWSGAPELLPALLPSL